MTKEQYEKQRAALMEEAQNFINSTKIEEANKKMEEINKLDADFENAIKTQANLDALNKVPMPVIENAITKPQAIEPLNVGNIVDVENYNEDLYVNAWAKDIMNKQLSMDEQKVFDAVNSAFTHTTENTGTVIPKTVTDGIFKEVGELHPLWEDVLKTHVKGKVALLRSTSSSNAGWYDESTETEDGKETFDEIVLSGWDLSRSITVSWKLREMSVKEFIPFIQSHLAEKVGEALGYAVAVGKGASSKEPKGIITALKAEGSTPQIVQYTDKPTYADITKCISLVKSAYKNGAFAYANNSTIWNVLANIVDGNGRPYFIADTTTGGVGRILGITVKEEASIPDGATLFGNAKRGYHANVNKDVILDSEDHKKKRETDYIAYGIIDGDVRTTKAFSLLINSTDMSLSSRKTNSRAKEDETEK